jgi:hypothetical protein
MFFYFVVLTRIAALYMYLQIWTFNVSKWQRNWGRVYKDRMVIVLKNDVFFQYGGAVCCEKSICWHWKITTETHKPLHHSENHYFVSCPLVCKWHRRFSDRKNVKLIQYQFWCTRCAFRLLKSLQWYSGRKSWKSEKKNVKTVSKPKETNTVPSNWAKSVEG